MPVVHHQVAGLDGTPATVSAVRIDLVTGDVRPVAFRKSDQAGLATALDVVPSGAQWSATLTRQSDIAPANSVYRVTEYVAGAQPVVWWFAVPDGPGPFELTTILTTAPNGLPPAIVVSQTITGGGTSSSQLTTTATAAAALSGHRVVTPAADGTVGYASNAAPGHQSAPLWLTNAAASSGAQVSLVLAGPVTEPSWSWAPSGAVYLGAAGALTQTPPSAAAGAVFLAQVGSAITPTSLYFTRQPSIALA